MTTTKTEGHRMLLAKIARTPGCRWFVHRDGTTYYSVLRSNAKVSGAGTASAGLPGYAPAHNGERK